MAALREHPAADRVEIAGSARRRAETCKDLDLVATASDPAALVEGVRRAAAARRGRPSGEAGVKAVTHNGLPVDFRIVPPENFGNLLQHFTGSGKHNEALRTEAVKRGLPRVRVRRGRRLDGDHARVRDRGGGLRAARHAVHRARAAREPRRAAGRAQGHELPGADRVDDIRGELHCHTVASDGRQTIEQMAEAARERGYEYLAITDHSASHGFGNHVTPDELRAPDRAGARAGRALDDFRCSPAPR